MSDRTNRREDIIRAALNLFVEQGYTATSVRQIAEVVGVTEAALYYHFKDGKRELLGAVVEAYLPDMASIIESAGPVESIYDLVLRFGYGLARFTEETHHIEKLRWAISEFPKLTPEERAQVQRKPLILQHCLRDRIRQFVDDDQTADQIAWTMMCASFGYGQLFINMALSDVGEFNPTLLIDMLANLLACRYGPTATLSETVRKDVNDARDGDD